MARTNVSSAPAVPESFLDGLRYILTPQLWKQVQAGLSARKACRWQPQPLLVVLLMVTWCAGDVFHRAAGCRS